MYGEWVSVLGSFAYQCIRQYTKLLILQISLLCHNSFLELLQARLDYLKNFSVAAFHRPNVFHVTQTNSGGNPNHWHLPWKQPKCILMPMTYGQLFATEEHFSRKNITNSGHLMNLGNIFTVRNILNMVHKITATNYLWKYSNRL